MDAQPILARIAKALARARLKRNRQLRALRRESERELHDMILRLLSKPMCERTHFLRRRIAIGSSAL